MVCTSPKAAETRALMRLIGDSTTLARQNSHLLNVEVRTRAFIDSRPLLESIGRYGLIEEKTLTH